jgi:hypothetical protein
MSELMRESPSFFGLSGLGEFLKLPHGALALSIAFVVYAVLCTSLYWRWPALRDFVDGLDFIAQTLEPYIRNLTRYPELLAQHGDEEWIPITRHLYAVSLGAIAIPTAAQMLHLPRDVGYLVERLAKHAEPGSFTKYVGVVLGFAGLLISGFYITYEWDWAFTSASSQPRDPGVRLIVFLPFIVFAFNTMLPWCMTMILTLFSPRVWKAFDY